MNTTNKVLTSVGGACMVSIIGFMIGGVFWLIMGFILTLLAIGLFSIWNK